MPSVDVVNLENKKVDKLELNEDLFAYAAKPYLLTEIVNWQRACRRAGTQSALTKAEVDGTTKKPFPQKGRGVARQGSLKNPHQVGGGVAFAPKPRDYSYQMPKAKKRAALAVALSTRLREKSLKIVENFELKEEKTSFVFKTLQKLKLEKTLVVDSSNDVLRRCMKNLKDSRFIDEAGLNVYDILKYPALTMTKKAVLSLEKRLLGEEEAS